MKTLHIEPRDPIIARDGRPSGEGNRMRSLNWIYPSVLAGSVRTLLGKTVSPQTEARPFDDETLLDRVKETTVTGPFPCAKDRLFFSAPRDVVIYEKDGQKKIMLLRPKRMAEGEGCDVPGDGCWPIDVTEDVKPAKSPAFWSQDLMVQWLTQDGAKDFTVPAEQSEDMLDMFAKEDRVHASIDPKRFATKDGMLFSTEGLAISPDDLPAYKARVKQKGIALVAKVSSPNAEMEDALSKLCSWHPLGGERRLAYFKGQAHSDAWSCPNDVVSALAGAKGVRMVLATPALFAGGWLPGWLDQSSLEGSPPGCTVRLRLRGACVGRWLPLSGWSLEKGRRGPKPVRRLVPDGSVYFFEVLSGDPQELRHVWLDCVSDEAQDRRDGFGASLWGVWNIS